MERPASVVKELIENSLDAGADNIEVEIDKGGHKRICIRDNGKGIDKDELALALSRHATSKIAHLDDLESIVSLGFRGEALASISSVARLTLTSKPAKQDQAWQAHAQGREMQVELNPAAHPNGTSVEVLDLFFNTPARRKFLRTEKTEFMHIDEVIRRIALSRSDVGLVLKHNGKVVRKYPALKKDTSPLKRVASICSSSFAQNAIQIQSQYQDFQLTGWLALPDQAQQHNDIQYVYVNGRMMRDKLINHAIRQAYEGLIHPDSQPAFVLYLLIDPAQVDVNVHPAKHEVRFHQSRLVHDFIFRAISDGLTQNLQQHSVEGQSALAHQEVINHDYIRPLQNVQNPSVSAQLEHSEPQPYSPGPASRPASYHSVSGRNNSVPRALSPGTDKQAAQHYHSLMKVPQQNLTAKPLVLPVGNAWLVVCYGGHYYKILCVELLKTQLNQQFNQQKVVSQPLLMPISVAVEGHMLARVDKLAAILAKLGLQINAVNKRILLKQVPAGMRQLNWATVLDQLFTSLLEQPVTEQNDDDEHRVKHNLFGLIAQQQMDSAADSEGLVEQLIHWLQTQSTLEKLVTQLGQQIELQRWLDDND